MLLAVRGGGSELLRHYSFSTHKFAFIAKRGLEKFRPTINFPTTVRCNPSPKSRYGRINTINKMTSNTITIPVRETARSLNKSEMEQQFALAWTTSLPVLRLEYNKLPFVWREILNFLEVRPIFATEI